MNTLDISVTINNETYTKHKGEFGCVRKYDQASSEDFILNIDFEIDCKKTTNENKVELKKAVLSYINRKPVPTIITDDYNSDKMPY